MKEIDLHNYQLKAVDQIIHNSHYALFLDMGLGKTVSTLTAINILMYRELDVSRVLVIAPKRVAENVWDEEIYKWDHLRHLTFSKITGSDKQRRKALAQKADIHLIGRDNIAWLCGLYGGSMLPYDMIVIDELSSFKNQDSVRFKALKNVRASVKRIVGLTGTPAPNGLIDLWAQIYLLDGGKRLGRFISHFRQDYFTPGKRNGDIVYNYKLDDDGADRIYAKISDICISMTAADYLELPGRIDNHVSIRFPDNIQKLYDDFEEEQVLSFIDSDKEISAVNAAALTNKLLQFANGAVYDENGIYHEVHDLKIEALKEIIEDANGKSVLVAWTYRHDRDRLMKALKKYKPRELKTKEDITAWNDGLTQVMLMHPASGGHGLNLQAGGHIIVWFGQTWSLELEQQFNARLDRQGQKEVVIINKLVAKTTVDEDVIASQNRKDFEQNSLIDAVKARIAKYEKQR